MTSSLDNKKTTISLRKGHCSQGYTSGLQPPSSLNGSPLTCSGLENMRSRGRECETSQHSSSSRMRCMDTTRAQALASCGCSWSQGVSAAVKRVLLGFFWARFLHSSCLRYSLYVLLKGCAALLGSWAVVLHTLLSMMEEKKNPHIFL